MYIIILNFYIIIDIKISVTVILYNISCLKLLLFYQTTNIKYKIRKFSFTKDQKHWDKCIEKKKLWDKDKNYIIYFYSFKLK